MAGYRLIVTEKPSVARDIGRVLGIRKRGRGYLDGGKTRITWCVGHLVQLAEPAHYNPQWQRWRLASLPMVPERFELQLRDTARDQYRIVAAQLQGADEVINACDSGREGELIFAWVYEHAGCKATVRRLWISSLTDGAIRDGFAKLRDGASLGPLQAAARCRAEADWLIGLNATRAMTTRFSVGADRMLLSVGRVQTPTLALLVHREEAIEAFVAEPFWQVKARLKAGKGEWDAMWSRPGSSGQQETNRLKSASAADEIAARLTGAAGKIGRVERKKSREKPPLLYDLPALQKEANRRFRYSAKHTLDIAQALYETHKLLTYPRTDSRHISADEVAGLPARLRGIAFGPYEQVARSLLDRWPIKLTKRVVDDAEVSDHHAIIPTGVDPRRASLNVDEKRVFDLVSRRFMAVMCDDAVFAVARIEACFGKDVLVARGRTCLAVGWREIDPPQSKKKELLLPPVDRGDDVAVRKVSVHEGTTKPPRRYTEATLLAAMEGAGETLDEAEYKRAMKRNGLGTAATRAAIIETILAREYAAREGANIMATSHGRALLGALPVPGLTSPKLTGAWEARLVAMAEGKEDRRAFMADIARYAEELVQAIVDVPDEGVRNAGFKAPEPTGKVLGECPVCGQPVRPRGPVFTCDTGRTCSFVMFAKMSGHKVRQKDVRAVLTDGETELIVGLKTKDGRLFNGVLVFADGRVRARRTDSQAPIPRGATPPAFGERVDCPCCIENREAAPGYLIAGRAAWGCSRWRDGCKLRVPFEMRGTRLSRDQVLRLLGKHRATKYESGFVAGGTARIVIDVAAEFGWRLERRGASRHREHRLDAERGKRGDGVGQQDRGDQ